MSGRLNQGIATQGLKKVPLHLQSAQTRLLIKGGKIINDDLTHTADIYIEDGVIKQMGHNLQIPGGTRTIDARGKLVLPGGIDTQTHFQLPFMGATVADDFYSGTKAALAGGTTMIIDLVLDSKDTRLVDAYKKWREWGDGKVCCDYSLAVGIPKWDENVEKDMEVLCKEEGVNCFKVMMGFKESHMLRDDEMYQVFKKCKELGALPMVYAENGDLVHIKAEEVYSRGIRGPEGHLLSRSEELEQEAVNRAITIASQANSPLYVQHVMSSTASEAIAKARKEGRVVYGEVTAAALAVDGKKYLDKSWEKAANHVSVPPLRNDPKTKDHLMNLLSCGILHTTASDHCPFPSKARLQGRDDFRLIPPGLHGVEERMAIMWEKGVNSGVMHPCQFVAATSTNAAKLFNIYPQKGRIDIGSDADLLIWDPNLTRTINAGSANSKSDYNLFEGLNVKGGPVVITTNGNVVYEDGELRVVQGRGRYLPLSSHCGYIYNKIDQRDALLRIPTKIQRDLPKVEGKPNPEPQSSGHGWDKADETVGTTTPKRFQVRVNEPPGGKTSFSTSWY
ncbi:dihydropyrimidinase-like [Lineus longissimus]|uniref:dihydropyrimidinase-like n=1 Tax=Lineus longissimus TaxID=88925 RepID=UPI002B4E22DD